MTARGAGTLGLWWLRDPNRTLTRGEIVDLLNAAGAQVISQSTADFELDLADWLAHTWLTAVATRPNS